MKKKDKKNERKKEDKENPPPKKFKEDKESSVIKSCEYTSIYSFGSNMYGGLCFGDTNNRNKPELVKSLKDKEIIQVCACEEFTILLSGIYINYFLYWFNRNRKSLLLW